MHFTQEDYKKIEDWLLKNSVKDSEFQEALPLNGSETVVITQNGHNRNMTVQELSNKVLELGVSDFINVSDNFDTYGINLIEAIRLIPFHLRKKGVVITFCNTENNWEIYQFTGALNQWNNVTLWNDIFNIERYAVNSLLPDEEDTTRTELDKNGNSYLKLKDKEYNPLEFSGYGKKILRKKIVAVKTSPKNSKRINILEDSVIKDPNTIYEIKYDFDLNGGTITLPENCVLLFNGGKISNGKLNLNNTLVYPLGIVKEDVLECTIVGNFKEGQIFFDKEQGQLSIWDGTSWKSRVNYKVVDNKLNETLDGGKTWTPVSDYISANFRWSPENTIQINRTGKEEDWEDLSYKFANNVFIKGYIASYFSLPSDPSLGDIYMVGTSAPYTMFVYTSDGWVDNGSYTSVAAGIMQTTGQSTTEVMSQKAVTDKLTDLESATDAKLTELGDKIAEKIGGEIIVHEEEKTQTIRFMNFETPLFEGQNLEITLTENAATMSQGINIYRVVSASAMYIIGHFDSVGQTINVVLDADAPGGLQFENLDANTTYGVKVVVNNIETGTINETIERVEQDIVGVSELFSSIAEEITSNNLFNKEELVAGYIIESTGGIYGNGNSFCSSQIPIIGGNYYYLGGRDSIGVTGIRCLDADGNALKVLVASSGDAWSLYQLPKEDGSEVAYNGQFKTPSNAVAVQFTVIYGNNGSVDNIMLIDLGNAYVANPYIPSYQPFGTSMKIKPQALPLSVNPLFGKSVIFTGDSICNATTDYPNGGGWAKRIGEKNNMTWVNRGVSGGTITDKNVVGSTFTISETDFGDGADYIILEGGTNDADRIGSILNGNVPENYGSWTIGDYLSEFSNDKFCSAVEMLLQKVITEFPSAKVGFIIAMKMGLTGQGYTADKYNRRAYFETIIEICKKWGVPVLNLWDECTMNPKIPSHYTEGEYYLYLDGQHPTGKGYDFISPIIEAWMKTL